MAARRKKSSSRSMMRSVDEGRAEEKGGTSERKEKVLHARIPHSLDREIKKRAENLGLSVSTVVRHVLLNTFDLVEDIVADGTNLALSITGGASRRVDQRTRRPHSSEQTGDSPSEVIGWQEAVLNRNALCDQCNGILAKGTRAAIGIRDTPGPQAILCLTCLDALTDAPSADASTGLAPGPSTAGMKRQTVHKKRATRRTNGAL